MGESQGLDPNLQVILNSIQLAIYVLILALAVVKLIKAYRNQRAFLGKFYICVTCIAAIQIGMQSYQLAVQVDHSQLSIAIFIIVNLYAITFEAFTIFMLSDYWNQTREIITKSSTQQELREVQHWARYIVFGLWTAGYSTFVIYSLVSDKINTSETYQQILALGFQSLAATIMLWAIVVQVMRGHTFSVALMRYQKVLKHITIKKIQFRLLYWMTSLFNFLRILFLITLTVIIDLYNKEIEWQWLAAYIYTFSNCAVLLVYIFGFSTQAVDVEIKGETLLDSEVTKQQDNRESRLSEGSKHETELSSSLSHKTH